MASESTEEGTLSVDLDADLEAWLDERATDHDLDREEILTRLLAGVRAADLDDATDATPSADPIADLRSEFQAKLTDVRERVVQVKREADAKAPADHTHDELERVDDVDERLSAVAETVEQLQADLASLTETVTEGTGDTARLDELESALADLDERLTTVAWVVTDLREAAEAPDGPAALSELKREAARLDVRRARCERCGEGVELALLCEPACPHCDATVTSVAESSGFFGKPTLLVAAQLESGADR